MSGGARPGTASHRRCLATAAVSTILLVSAGCGGGGDPSAVDPSTTAPTTPSVAVAADPTPSPTTGDEVTPVDGVYGVSVTEADATAAGIPHGWFTDTVGDYELDLVRGRVQMFFTHGVSEQVLAGAYRVDGDTLRIADDGGARLTFTWDRHAGTLELRLVETSEPHVRAADELIFASEPWERLQ